MIHLTPTLVSLAVASLAATNAFALTVPYQEDFTDGLSGWTGGTGVTLNLISSGGSDGGAYLSRSADIAPSGFGNVQVLFRCEAASCSDGNFSGAWLNNVGALGWYFRHNADVALQAYARLAPQANFPGASATISTLVQPNTWTLIELDITPGNPDWTSFSGQSFESVFASISRLQLGITIPTGFTGTGITFDLDQASVTAPVPLPAAGWALVSGTAALVGTVRRRVRGANRT